MDADIVFIYQKLRNRYPITLSSSLAMEFKTTVDFLVLSGISSLGRFEMFFDDVPSFAFYAMYSNGEVFAHKHLRSAEEAEKTVADFMEGKLTLISFGQSYNL